MSKGTANKIWKSVDFDTLFLSGISVDTVIFGFHDRQLMVLLLQYRNTNSFALPGGFIHKKEGADHAAQRVLKERTGLSDIFLEQFHTFANSDRSDPSFFKTIMKARGHKPVKDHFLLRRFITIGYYALVDFTRAIPTSEHLIGDCKWHDLKNLPDLIQDHQHIIAKALSVLRENLDQKLVGFNLLSEKFTMSELQVLYETILEKRFLRTSFQRRMLSLGILKKVATRMGVAHKAPYLYSFVSE
jgi:ADP-ribose pyrophosphatase YjhB (NUDIX family)